MMEYKVGDTVIHCSHGMGEIIKMDEKFIHERTMLCYVVRTHNLTVWVKADEQGTSSIRPPTPDKDFEKLFDILCSPGEPLPAGWHERKIALFERMKDGDLTSICHVIRDLTSYRRARKFNDSDKTILDKAESLLITEWMFSRSVSWVEARDELMRLLE
ncbi:MAG: hypothetical protein EHM41_02190 [Chloroflexi bacterium]|nr:MAG: hypothetical protein EHM41_02190 [Chloroflexota bacterium]